MRQSVGQLNHFMQKPPGLIYEDMPAYQVIGFQPQIIQGKRRGKSMNRMAQSVDFNMPNNNIFNQRYLQSQDFVEPKGRMRRDPSPIIGVYSPEHLSLSDIFVGGGNAYSAQE
jgi:hypothetical protein